MAYSFSLDTKIVKKIVDESVANPRSKNNRRLVGEFLAQFYPGTLNLICINICIIKLIDFKFRHHFE